MKHFLYFAFVSVCVLGTGALCVPNPEAPYEIPNGDPQNPGAGSSGRPLPDPMPGDVIAVSVSRSVVPTGETNPCKNKVILAFDAPVVGTGPEYTQVDCSEVKLRIAEVRKTDGSELIYAFPNTAQPEILKRVDQGYYGRLSLSREEKAKNNCDTANPYDEPKVYEVPAGSGKYEAVYFPPDFVAEPYQVTIAFYHMRTGTASANARLINEDSEFLLGTAVVEIRPPDRNLTVELKATRTSIATPSGDPSYKAYEDETYGKTSETILTAEFDGGTPTPDPDWREYYQTEWFMDEMPISELPNTKRAHFSVYDVAKKEWTPVPLKWNPQDRDLGSLSFIDKDGDGVEETLTAGIKVMAAENLVGTPLFRAVVKDKINTTSATLVINVATALQVTLSQSPARPMPGDAVNVSTTVSGGVPPYTYTWSNSFFDANDNEVEIACPFDNQKIVDQLHAGSVSLHLPPRTPNYDRWNVGVIVKDQQLNEISKSLSQQYGGNIPIPCASGSAPAITGQPDDVAWDPVGGCPGTVAFKVVADGGKDADLMTVTWQRDQNDSRGFEDLDFQRDPGKFTIAEDTTDGVSKRTITATLTVRVCGEEDDGHRYKAIIRNKCGDAETRAAVLDSRWPAPTVAVASSQTNPTNSGTILFAVSFDEKVKDFDNLDPTKPDVIISGDAGANQAVITNPSADHRTYLVAVSGMTAIGDNSTVTISVAAGVCTDIRWENGLSKGGNPNKAAAQPASVVFDVRPPVIASVASNKPDGACKAGEVIDIQVEFDEKVDVTGSPVITLDNGQHADFSGGSGTKTLIFNYVVTAGGDTAHLEYNGTDALLLNGGTIRDKAANDAVTSLPPPGSGGSLGDQKHFVIDTIQPKVALLNNHPDNIVHKGDVVQIIAVFTDADEIADGVNGGPGPTITIGLLVVAAPMAKVSNTQWEYVWAVPPGQDKNGAAPVSIAATDRAGNLTESPVPPLAYGVDNTPPTVSIGDPGPAHTNTGPVEFAIAYTGADSVDLRDSDVTVTATGGAACTTLTVTGGNTATPTVTLSGLTGSGTLVISIAAGRSADLAGNADDGAGPSVAVNVDNAKPTVAIGNPSPANTNTGPVEFVIAYAGADSVDLRDNDVTVTPTGGAGYATLTVTGAKTATPTVTLSGLTGSGTLAINIAAGRSSDLAGNTDEGAGPSVVVNVDDAKPTAAIGNPSPANTNTGPVEFAITYAGADSVDLRKNDVTVTATGGAACTTLTVTGGKTATPTVTLSGLTGSGTLAISIAAGRSTDLAGNTDDGAGPSAVVNIDNAKPTVTIGNPSPANTNTGPVEFAITYAGADTVDLRDSDVTVTPTGGAGYTTLTVTAGQTATPTVTLSGLTGSGTLAISIAAGRSSDLIGNTDDGAVPSAVINVDNQAPDDPTNVTVTAIDGTVRANALNSTNTNMTAEARTVAGQATGGVAELLMNGASLVPQVLDNNIAAGDTKVTFNLGTGNNTELQARIPAGLNGGVLSVRLTDALGNASTGTGPSVTVDYTRPQPQSVEIDAGKTIIDITFTEKLDAVISGAAFAVSGGVKILNPALVGGNTVIRLPIKSGDPVGQTVTIDGVLRDEAGNPLAVPVSVGPIAAP